MENGQKSISELFDGRKTFNIPKYQRAYAWGEKQLKDFVEDIENQNLDKNHFFGTLLLQLKGEKIDGFDKIDVVDGQQRITTVIIFMKLLLERAKQAGIEVTIQEDTYIQYHSRYKLHALEIDNDFFVSYILENNTPQESQVHTPSQRRLLEAKEFLSHWLEEHSEKIEIEAFIEKVENMKVLTYSVKDDAEATVIFETTNDRGKSLTNLEKTKSFLMHKSYIISDDNSGSPERFLESLQHRFTEIYRIYEEIESRIDEDAILQYHFIAFEEWKHRDDYRNPVQAIKEHLNNLIHENSVAAADFIDRCSLGLKESFETVRTVFMSSEHHLLDIFALSRQATFYPLLIKTHKFDSGAMDDFKQVARLVEIICFRMSIIGYRANKGEAFLYKLANEFNGNFEELIAELRNFVFSNCGDTDFSRALRSPIFYDDVNGEEQRYLFWKYENYLREIDGYPKMSYDEFTNANPKTKFSIEHIIPQTPQRNKVFEEGSMPTADYFASSEFKENYLHSIGNLTIDPIAANARKSNQNFEIKDQTFRKAPLMAQRELGDFRNQETGQWDEKSITDRTQQIIDFALKQWDFKQAESS